MDKLIQPVNEQDYEKIMDLAHQLKSAAGYAGASHLHYACYFIQEHYMNGRYQEQIEYYPTLIEAAVTFRVYSRKVLANYHRKTYTI